MNRALELTQSDRELQTSAPLPDVTQEISQCAFSIDALAIACHRYKDRPAFGSRTYEIKDGNIHYRSQFATITYHQLWLRIQHIANGLYHGNLACPGEIVNLIGFSSEDIFTADLALHYLAAVSTPIAYNFSPNELTAILNECESRTILCSVEQLEAVCEVLHLCQLVRHIIVIDLVSGDHSQCMAIGRAKKVLQKNALSVDVLTLADVERVGEDFAVKDMVRPRVGSDPLMSLCYTSGSTGRPKGTMYTESRWLERWSSPPLAELAWTPLITLLFFPANHMAGRKEVMNTIRQGGVLYFTLKSDMSTLFEDIRLVRPTFLHLVPRISEMIFRYFQVEVAKLCPTTCNPEQKQKIENLVIQNMRASYLGDRLLLLISSSAPTPPEVINFLQRCFEVPVLEYYASSECGQMLVDGKIVSELVDEFKLVDVPELNYYSTDKPYPRGELYIKTTRMIQGYYKNDEASKEIFDDQGFFRTSDIFQQINPERLQWLDRKSNLLKLSHGEYVALWKLESLFSSGSRFINQIYLYGNSQKSFLLAVIVPQEKEFRSVPDQQSLKSLIRLELSRIAAEQSLRAFEVPRDFILESEPFSQVNGLLTSLNKPARPNLKAKYDHRLEGLYAEIEIKSNSKLGLMAEHIPVARKISTALERVLGIESVDLSSDHTFRSLGGDSLGSAQLIDLIETSCGVTLSMSFVHDKRTRLSDILGQVEKQLAHDTRNISASFTSIHGAQPTHIHQKDLRLEKFIGPEELEKLKGTPPIEVNSTEKKILLTGATGFLGRHLCIELLRYAKRKGGRVFALVRANNETEAFAKLSKVYCSDPQLLVEFHALANDHLQLITGSLETSKFGLSAADYHILAREVDLIVHAAAVVNHRLGYRELFAANVLGTLEVLKFAATARRKSVNYVSTIGVAIALLDNNNYLREDDDIYELRANWPIDESRYANGYALSKWASELLVKDFNKEFDAPVNVFRCDTILPHSNSPGQLNNEDFLARLLCSLIYTGIAPRSFYAQGAKEQFDPYLEGLPVDFVSAAITAIALQKRSQPISAFNSYQVGNPGNAAKVNLDTVVIALQKAGHDIMPINNYEQWYNDFSSKLNSLSKARQSNSSLSIINQWRRPISTNLRCRIDATRFREAVKGLQPQGMANLPVITEQYVLKCIEDLRLMGLVRFKRKRFPCESTSRKAA